MMMFVWTKQAEIHKYEQTSFENSLNQDFGPWCQSLAVFGVFSVRLLC